MYWQLSHQIYSIVDEFRLPFPTMYKYGLYRGIESKVTLLVVEKTDCSKCSRWRQWQTVHIKSFLETAFLS